MAAIFPARIVLSTTGGSGERAADRDRFERTEVEVVEDGSCLAMGQGPMIALQKGRPVAKEIRQCGWRLVEQHEIHASARGLFEIGYQRPNRRNAERRAGLHSDRNVHVARRMWQSASRRSEQQRIGEARVSLEHHANSIRIHGATIARAAAPGHS